jgi:N-acetylglucosaminyldiphosphoundecaprenol N-acetyl-beta-D-mannosaminyltransferase
MNPPPRANILGVGVHALDLESACALVVDRARTGPAGYVCCCDVNSVSCAHRDPRHRAILNHAFLATPDGMPVVWLARTSDIEGTQRVYGPDLLLAVCDATNGSALRHYFYGGGEGTADLLVRSLQARYPALNIAGTSTPPVGIQDDNELNRVAAEIERTRADLIWIGLSTPKQEAVMAALAPRLRHGVLLGVGAAFDFHSGRIRQAPRWIQRSGFEWLWRLSREPRRLGLRYLRNNPLFVLRALAQISGLKHYPLELDSQR